MAQALSPLTSEMLRRSQITSELNRVPGSAKRFFLSFLNSLIWRVGLKIPRRFLRHAATPWDLIPFGVLLSRTQDLKRFCSKHRNRSLLCRLNLKGSGYSEKGDLTNNL